MDNVPGFIKINKVDGFKSLKYRDGVEVKDDDYLYLRQNHYDRLNMISLGTLKEATQRSKRLNMPNHILGIHGDNYGEFGTLTINDNLFVQDESRLPDDHPRERKIPILQSLAMNALSPADSERLRLSGFLMPPPSEITHSDGSNQNAGKLKHRKSRSRKSRSKKSRSKKSRSRKSRSRRVRQR
jgi:hypothetical protein